MPDEPGALWYDDEAGPMVRPYTVTRGRTCAADGAPALDMIAMVSLVGPAAEPAGAGRDEVFGGGGGESAGADGDNGPAGAGESAEGDRGARSEAGDAVKDVPAAGGGAGPAAEGAARASRLDPLGDEHIALLDMCRTGGLLSVAELAAGADLPLGVVRVLLGDLLDAGRIRITRPVPPAELPDVELLNHVISGLKSL